MKMPHNATDKFWHIEHNAKEGVMSYYYKLECYATRMIQTSNPFMFKMQLVARLPANIISFVLDKGCSAETSSVDDILHFACQAEEIGKMRKHFNKEKHIMDSTKLKSTSLTKHLQPDPSQERSHEWSQDHHQKHNRKYHDNAWQSGSRYLDGENQCHSKMDCCDKDQKYSRHKDPQTFWSKIRQEVWWQQNSHLL